MLRLFAAFTSVWLMLAAAAFAQRPSQPNFVLILADDLGWQDLKCYDTEAPFSVFQTPHLDALARGGVLFRQAYAPAPVCAPSRVGIMSGKHPARAGKTSVEGGECPKPNSINSRMMDPYYTARMALEEITIPEALKPHGYFSGHMGKWHMAVGHNAYPNALDQGFDWSRANRGVTVAMANRTAGFATTSASDPYRLDANGFAFDQLTQDALDFLNTAAATNKPFFCYYASWLVHAPIHMRTESLLQKYAGLMGYSYPLTGAEFFAPGQNNPYYAAMVETFDYNVHQIVSRLESTDDPRWPGHKLIENTYVFITSDNGGMEFAGENVTDNAPLDQGKIHTEEGGTRVPFIVLGPNIPTNVTSEVMVNGLDLYPTMLALAGIPIPDRLDGVDLSGLLLNDPQNANLVTNRSGEVRDTMYWHFPHGVELRSTIRKNGWKLFKNYDFASNAARNPYELYELYDTNRVRHDIGEAFDVVNTATNVAAQLTAELNTWLTNVGARLPSYNPKTAVALPNKSQVPAVLGSGHTNSLAWVTWETNKAAVATVELIYTLNGDNSSIEEWFSQPVAFTPSSGYAETPIPDGTTHFLFTLVDTNNFLVSSADVGDGSTNTGKDSTRVPRYIREPAVNAALVHAGTVFPAGDVIISNALGALAGSQVKDSDTNNVTLAAGQTFTITRPTRLAKLTLKSATTKAFDSGDHRMALWIGSYSNNMPGPAAADTRVFEWVDLANQSITNNEYLTLDFTDVDMAAGTYAFQLAWRSHEAANHLVNFYRDDTNPYPGGHRLYKSAPAGTSIGLPFSGATETTDKDLVFALHGTVTDYYGHWVAEYGLDMMNLNAAPELNTVQTSSTGRLERDSIGFCKANTSAWTVSGGVLANVSSSNNTVGEGALGRMVNLSSFSNLHSSQLSLGFDYSPGDPGEILYVHLWGYVDGSSASNTPTMNLGAQNGNAWESAAGAMTAYNLGKANGTFTGTPGANGNAAVILTGSSGTQSYTNTFNLVGFTSAPSLVSGYDHLALGFAREIGGAASPGLNIRNVVLAVVGGDRLLAFVQNRPAEDLAADPDGDQCNNLWEYSLGGNPTNTASVGHVPSYRIVDAGGARWFEYVHARRRDAVARGLSYAVEFTPKVFAPAWATAGVSEVGTAVIDADFENVTNRLSAATGGFVRLKVQLNQ